MFTKKKFRRKKKASKLNIAFNSRIVLPFIHLSIINKSIVLITAKKRERVNFSNLKKKLLTHHQKS